jgi:23S rRNA maturation-related 3'-5' exoribonuclease YhaM
MSLDYLTTTLRFVQADDAERLRLMREVLTHGYMLAGMCAVLNLDVDNQEEWVLRQYLAHWIARNDPEILAFRAHNAM